MNNAGRHIENGQLTCSKCGNKLPATKEFFHIGSNHKTGFASQCKICRNSHRDSIKEFINNDRRIKYTENKEIILTRNRIYYNANKHKRRDYEKTKRKVDTQFVMKERLRDRITKAMRQQGIKKTAKTEWLIGCSVKYLMSYLESQFTPGMTWENRGRFGWHIDHIRPCASFDLSDPEQQRQCFNYTNLQPLWRDDNYRKGSKYI